jgi:hypothetical protein
MICFFLKKLFEPSRLFFFLTFFHVLAFECAAYYVLFRFGTDWLGYLTALLFFIIAQVYFVLLFYSEKIFFFFRCNVVIFNMI